MSHKNFDFKKLLASSKLPILSLKETKMKVTNTFSYKGNAPDNKQKTFTFKKEINWMCKTQVLRKL